MKVFTRTVTEIQNDFGMVGDDVFFLISAVKGPLPKVGDLVLIQVEAVTDFPFQFVAKRVQRLRKEEPADSLNADDKPREEISANINTDISSINTIVHTDTIKTNTDSNIVTISAEELAALKKKVEKLEGKVKKKKSKSHMRRDQKRMIKFNEKIAALKAGEEMSNSNASSTDAVAVE